MHCELTRTNVGDNQDYREERRKQALKNTYCVPGTLVGIFSLNLHDQILWH